MQQLFTTLQQIAFTHVILPSGRTREMYSHEMIDLAREACDQLGIRTQKVHARNHSKPAAGQVWRWIDEC